jgi:DUF1680 family protein
MNRRGFVRSVAAVPLAMGLGRLEAVRVESSANESKADGGISSSRYELTLQRVLNGKRPAYTEEFLLADVKPKAERRFTEYSGDLSGRYIGALSTATIVHKSEFPGLDGLVAKTIALQKPEGYFGSGFDFNKPSDKDLALLWGNGRLLVGLLEYYRLRPSAQVLDACKRLGDFLVKIGPLMLSREMREEFGAQHFASSYICWMQQTEGLAGLYAVTKDERYKKLAEEIAAVIERRPSDHVHGYLTSLRGVVDLYRATNDPKLLQQCETAWQDVAQSKDLLITGGVPEGWSPNNHRTEGCGEADWVRLSLGLWKETGKPEYLAAAEKAIFNEMAFNQYATGDFGHRRFTETGWSAEGGARAWWCCTLHGLRCFPDIHASVFSVRNGSVYYDLPLDGRIETAGFSASAEASMEEDGGARIKILEAGGKHAALGLRVPEWSEGLDCKVNGAAVQPAVEKSSGYGVIERTWAAGDVVEVKYKMQLRSAENGNDRVAYWFGPWLLGAASVDNLDYFNELTVENRLVAGKEAVLPGAKQPQRQFTVPVAATAVPVVHAEYADQSCSVVLRAIAEQTGMETTSWEMRFLRQGQALGG